jgi:hypothetical protein
MQAARIHTFGPPSVMVIDELPRPASGHGKVLVRVAAAGVGPWDALIRAHKSMVQTPLPLMLGISAHPPKKVHFSNMPLLQRATPLYTRLGKLLPW